MSAVTRPFDDLRSHSLAHHISHIIYSHRATIRVSHREAHLLHNLFPRCDDPLHLRPPSQTTPDCYNSGQLQDRMDARRKKSGRSSSPSECFHQGNTSVLLKAVQGETKHIKCSANQMRRTPSGVSDRRYLP